MARKGKSAEKKEAGASVIDIGQLHFEKWLADPNARSEIPKDAVLSFLQETAGRIPPDGLLALNLPKRIYTLKGPAFTSFSSEKDRGIEEFARCLLNGDDLPAPSAVADYGIYFGFRGGSTMCVLFDRKRRVAVSEEVRNMQANEGSWTYFLYRLNESLADAEGLERKGERFTIIVNGTVIS